MNNNNDYYSEKINEIKDLIKSDLDKAHAMLMAELNMPYIPAKYEPSFANLLAEITDIITDKQNHSYELSKDNILEILQSEDSIKVGLALSKLRDLNLNSMINGLQIVFNSKQPNAIKAVIYEYLCEQKIDHDFKINETKLNATKNLSIISPEAYKDAYVYIENNVLHDPSLGEVATNILEIYALNLFPKFVESNNLGEVIIDIAKESLGLPTEEINNNLLKIKEKVKNIYKNNL